MSTLAPSPDRIETLRFARRKESWVAATAGHFYKIVRKGDDPLQDLDDPECTRTATREYNDLRFLGTLADRVCRPERIDRACVVYPLLSGPDMRMLLLDRGMRARHRACLHSAMRLLAAFHHGDAAAYPAKDYRRDGFLAPAPHVLDRMQGRPRTLVVTGFEARNFRFDEHRNAWYFFDPHHVWRGYPEEDLARFIVSLLMLPGRRSGPRAWTRFDRCRLLAEYEAAAPAKLDRQLLNWFLAEELAKRRYYALQSAQRMPAAGRPFGVAYTALYYHGLRRAIAAQRF
ncbi:MAG: hypothetical protein ACREPJ_08985 [Rhodanobacteraceae bacterium]